MSTLVAPFYRASVVIRPAERPLFVRGLPREDFERRLRGASPVLRQNLRRLFAAALLAQATGGRLAFVEGFRSNVLEGRRGKRFVAGSRIFALFHRVLERRGLVPAGPRPLRQERSRCTAEEAQAIVALAESLPQRPRIIGVSDTPCPSAWRAGRYLRVLDAAAITISPEDARRSCGAALSSAQAGFWSAVAPRPLEAALAHVVEAPNWVVHALPRPMEIALAHALRRDR
jgi:hypothetical protein